ncbi:hypothetical protein H8R23_10280 [Flavobacterium sp. F-380]|uniref:Peroxiredoxin C-terminal domain-containing protein n=1 Tax=Flavobacterium kayseriense TaxID=2764714 RepID=A0ABR7J9B3_9FLAO|nr:hypothetical protein [Flavobacterium kayseriense]MBC5848321.1 hypothetical protein [Flavobacterium kayseriense]
MKRSPLALHTSDEYKAAMPVDWQPGDKAIVPALKTVEGSAERKKSNLEMIVW